MVCKISMKASKGSKLRFFSSVNKIMQLIVVCNGNDCTHDMNMHRWVSLLSVTKKPVCPETEFLLYSLLRKHSTINLLMLTTYMRHDITRSWLWKWTRKVFKRINSRGAINNNIFKMESSLEGFEEGLLFLGKTQGFVCRDKLSSRQYNNTAMNIGYSVKQCGLLNIIPPSITTRWRKEFSQ